MKGLCEDILMTNYGIARQRWDMEMATKHLFDWELVCLQIRDKAWVNDQMIKLYLLGKWLSRVGNNLERKIS